MLDEISKTTNNAAVWYRNNTRTFWILLALLVVAILGTCVYINHTPKKPVEGIVKPDKEIAHDVQVVLDDHTVDSLKKIIDKKDAIAKDYKTKWLAAVAKNKANVAWVETIDTIPMDWKQRADELTQDAVSSDSLCTELVEALESKSVFQDSAISKLELQKSSLAKSFNELAYNSSLKDAQIKKINKSLRIQKVQNTVFKGAALVAAIFIIKSAIK